MNMGGWEIREEALGDAAKVFEVEASAFETTAEAQLVDLLREQVKPHLSLVAAAGDAIIGHVFFSPVAIEGNEAPSVGGLAPLAVRPDLQGRGVGGDLVRAGLQRALRLGWKAVFLLGDPAYYSRFGFELAAPHGFHYVSEQFDPGFQLILLDQDALRGRSGLVRYPAAFDAL